MTELSPFLKSLNSSLTNLSAEEVSITEKFDLYQLYRKELLNSIEIDNLDLVYELTSFTIVFSYFCLFESQYAAEPIGFQELLVKFILILESSDLKEIIDISDVDVVLNEYYCKITGINLEIANRAEEDPDDPA